MGWLSGSAVCISSFLIFLLSHNAVSGEHVAPTARIALIDAVSGGVVRAVTDKVNHEVILTSPTREGQAYLFECNASYPVEWSYFGEGAPATNADVGRHFKDFYNVNTYTYSAILRLFQLDELQSGRYICRGSHPDQQKLQIQYDLFVPGNGTQVLISTSDKKVFVPESKLLISLPCEVTDPSMNLRLYKANEWGSYFKVELNDSIAFRPRKGFILKMHELLDPFGVYLCSTPDNKRQRKIYVIPERFRSKYDDDVGHGPKTPVHITYDFEYNRMLCCGGANSGNVNALAPKLEKASCSSIMDCRIKSVCFEEGHCGRDDGQMKWRDPGPLPRGCSGWKLNDGPEGDFGIFKCSTPGVTQYQPYLFSRGSIFVDFDVAPPSESILTLAKLSSGPIILGSEVEYTCNSTKFYFAYGIRWAFKKGNDDIEFVRDSSPYIIRDEFPLASHQRRTRFRIMQHDIKAVICFVPIANSPTEWRTVSLPISVLEPLRSTTTQASTRIPPTMGPYDYVNNRIPQVSAPIGQGYHQRTMMESYSTSKPILIKPQFPDPTPSVDIDAIMSIGGNHQHEPMGSSSEIRHNFRDKDFPYGSGRTAPQSGQYMREQQPAFFSRPPPQQNPTDIITLDNVKRFGNLGPNKFNLPSPSEIQEANMLHRQRHGMQNDVSHAGSAPATTAYMPPTVASASFPAINQNQQFSGQDREYKVSSAISIGSHSNPNNYRGSVQDDERYSPRPIYEDVPRVQPPQHPEVTPRPQYSKSPQRQPVIHYDSRERQFGLRESPPSAQTHTPQQWKTPKPLFSSTYVNQGVPRAQHESSQQWENEHSYRTKPYRSETDFKIPESSSMFGDEHAFHSHDDYYEKSLRAKQERRSKKKSAKSKSKLRTEPSYSSNRRYDNHYEHDHGHGSITPSEESSRSDEYLLQRYATKQEPEFKPSPEHFV